MQLLKSGEFIVKDTGLPIIGQIWLIKGKKMLSDGRTWYPASILVGFDD